MLKRCSSILLACAALFAPARIAHAQSAPEPREVLILINQTEHVDLRGEGVPIALETVLNHLGFIVHYHDLSVGLPDPAVSARARAVVCVTEGNAIPNAAAYARWLIDRMHAGQPIALLGGMAFLTDAKTGAPTPKAVWQPLFDGLGIHYDGEYVGDPTHLGIAYQAPQTHYESAWEDRPPFYIQVNNTDPQNTVFLRMKRSDTGQTSDMGVLGPRGAAIFGSEYLFDVNPVSYRASWRVDPFWLLHTALHLPNGPALDPSTINGMRAFYAHIDGDGFYNVAYRRGRPLASEVIRDELLKKTSLPTTVSIIARDMIGHPERQAIARSLFALPNVEPASHTYTHPHSFETGEITPEGGASEGGGGKGFKHQKRVKLSAVHEVDDSIHYIQQLVPPGKHVAIMLWSGETDPTEPFLERCSRIGIENMNGGDGMLDLRHPSYANLAPLARQVGNHLQIYTSAANENLFTNLWTGPFDGQRAVLKTFVFQGAPHRIAPVNIYYHYYCGERMAGLRALQDLYHWAEAQPLAPIFASRYAKMVRGFYAGEVTPVDDHTWHVAQNGECRTVRFDQETRLPDLARCQNVAGYNHANGSLYVHLGPGDATVVLADQPARRPHLDEASAPLDAFQADDHQARYTFGAVAPLRVELAGLQPDAAVSWKGPFDGPHRADATGHLALHAPLGTRALEVRW